MSAAHKLLVTQANVVQLKACRQLKLVKNILRSFTMPSTTLVLQVTKTGVRRSENETSKLPM